MDIILASQSPRRQELLRNITPDFTVQVSQVEENLAPGTSPGEAVEQLALRKAQAVFCLQPDPEDCIVIGSDTVVAIDGRILGKPHSREECLGSTPSTPGWLCWGEAGSGSSGKGPRWSSGPFPRRSATGTPPPRSPTTRRGGTGSRGWAPCW